MKTFKMRQSYFGKFVVRWYQYLPLKKQLEALILRSEGGQMTSISLRQLLSKYYEVNVGSYSYGSLLVPGSADKKTVIGRYVSIGKSVLRIGAQHPIDRPDMHPFWYNPEFGIVERNSDVERSALEICDGVWIGSSVVILPGCRRIGRGAVVGAGAVVTRNVEDFEVVAGVPAQHLKHRLPIEVRKALVEADPWRLEPREAFEVITDLGFR